MRLIKMLTRFYMSEEVASASCWTLAPQGADIFGCYVPSSWTASRILRPQSQSTRPPIKFLFSDDEGIRMEWYGTFHGECKIVR